MTSPIEIFCCYAREDQPFLLNLKKHLKLLQRQGLITIWSDVDINAGEAWEMEIHKHLNSAHVILLLISANFMDSEYCYSTEMHQAMQRHEQGKARVIPVLLRRTLWDGAPFKHLQFLPTHAKPVVDRDWTEDDALYDVAENINGVVKKLRLKLMLDEAQTLLATEHIEEALIIYEQILELDTNSRIASYGKANALFKLERYNECLSAAEQALQIDESLADALFYYHQAQAFHYLLRDEESLLAYDKAINCDPSIDYLYIQKAELLIQIDKKQLALKTYEQLISFEPNQAEYHHQKALLLMDLNRSMDAIEAFGHCIELAPNTALYHVDKGDALATLGQDTEALTCYRKASELKPLKAEFYKKQAVIQIRLKNYASALYAYEQLGPDISDPYCYHGKGIALVGLERYEDGLDAYKKALALSEFDPDPIFYHDIALVHEYLAKQAHEQEARISLQPVKKQREIFSNTFNPQTIDIVSTFRGNNNSVYSIAFSPDSQWLAIGGNDGTIRLWDVNEKKFTLSLPRGKNNHIVYVAFSPDGQWLAIGGSDGKIHRCDLPSGKTPLYYPGNSFAIRRIDFSSDGKWLASKNSDCLISLWDLSTNKLSRTFTASSRITNNPAIQNIAFSPNSQWLATNSGSATQLWDPHTGKLVNTFRRGSYAVYSVAFSHDNRWLASGSGDGVIRLWNPRTGKELHTFSGSYSITHCVTFSSDNQWLASGSSNGVIRLWDPRTEELLRTLPGNGHPVRCLAFSPNNQWLASGTEDGIIQLWGETKTL